MAPPGFLNSERKCRCQERLQTSCNLKPYIWVCLHLLCAASPNQSLEQQSTSQPHRSNTTLALVCARSSGKLENSKLINMPSTLEKGDAPPGMGFNEVSIGRSHCNKALDCCPHACQALQLC